MRTRLSFSVLALVLSLSLVAGCQSAAPAPATPAAAPTQQASAAGQPTAASAPAAQTSNYPTKQIEMVVHSGAGSSVDLTARVVADYLAKNKMCSQPIVVNNRQGGGGAVALDYMASKKGDSYVIQSVSGSNFLSNLARGDTVGKFEDFTQIAIMAMDSNVVAVAPNSPYKTVKDIVDAAKKKPKSVAQSIGAIGGSGHIIGAMVAQSAGVEFNYISFKSGAEALTAVMNGSAAFAIENLSEMSELVRGGKLRMVAVGSEKRLSTQPDLPTMKEQGVPVTYELSRGFALPKGASDDAIKYWESSLKKVYDSPEWDKFTKDGGMEKVFMNSAESSKWLKAELDLMIPALQYLGLTKK